MQLTFLGHACFLIENAAGKKIIVDPFIKDNPMINMDPEEIDVDLIVVTHGHFDHLGDAISIAKRCGCQIVSVVELCKFCNNQGAKVHGMQLGGSFDFGFVQIKLTPALHTSSTGEETSYYLGNPAGALITMDGMTIYHAGDTGLFGDMALIGRKPIQVALLPIGDNFTMGMEDAVEATKMLHPKFVIPMHYNTWDIIKQDAGKFKKMVESESNTIPIVLVPEQKFQIPQRD